MYRNAIESPRNITSIHPNREATFRASRDDGYDELFATVKEAYARRYGACLDSCLPFLAGIRNPDGTLLAVAGRQPAGDYNLFLEQYLDQPVEDIISAACGISVNRGRIVEVGNLVLLNPFAAKRVFVRICESLLSSGFEWVVVTAIRELCALFRCLGQQPLILGHASRERVANPASWGSYYSSHPAVLAGYLPTIVDCLQRHCRSSLENPSVSHS